MDATTGISIHAPARGATSSNIAAEPVARISIHAPARGATLSADTLMTETPLFQSTLPRGERHSHEVSTFLHSTISIHAPARGATCPEYQLRRSKRISIHAPARGATSYRGPIAIHAAFQSTLPRGERPEPPTVILSIRVISIHAPARGATIISRSSRQSASLFQSTLPRGERRINHSHFRPR